MRVGRKGVLVLLAVVALWTALPVVACAAEAATPPCCHGMMDCGSPAHSVGRACCQIHRDSPALLAGQTSASDHFHALAQIAVPVIVPAPLVLAGVNPPIAGAPPPEPSPGSGSILRI